MYNANDLHERLVKAFTSRYPNWRSLRLVFSGATGQGKSVVMASVPVPESTQRLILDNEDSCAYLDAGEDGVDVYTPRRQQFKMKRVAFPTLENYANLYQLITQKPETIGSVGIDNGAILQDIIMNFLMENSSNPKVIRDMYKRFGAERILPFDGIIRRWAEGQTSGNYWQVVKEPFKRLILECSKRKIHFIMTTEEANVWRNYGKPNAEIIGQRAKVWDVVERYTDAIIGLQRNVNSTEPPFGQLYAKQSKIRMQGMNPRFQMDWEGFIAEIEEAAERTNPDVPQEAQAVIPDAVTEE